MSFLFPRAQPEQYSALIRAGDVAGIMDLLTDVSVEQKVVERVHVKAATFGQDIMSVENGTTQQGAQSDHQRLVMW